VTLIDVVVTDIVQETPTVKSLQLARPDGTPLGRYLPGAHVDVVGPTAVTRQYSLCSRPDDGDSYLVAVKREENSRGTSCRSPPTARTTSSSPPESASRRC
jgi:ferredoxin-NADP reductase